MGIKIIGYIELGLVGFILIVCAAFCLKKRQVFLVKNLDIVDNEIRMPKAFPILGIIALVGNAALAIFGLLVLNGYELSRYTENLVGVQLFMVFVLGSALLLLYSLNWRICIYEEHFTYTNTFGITHTYRYDEIRVKKDRAAYRYYRKGHRIFSIGFMQPNHEALSLKIAEFTRKSVYKLPIRQRNVDVEALRGEEAEWLKTAAVNDKAIYYGLIEKLRTTCISDYIEEIKEKTVLSYFEKVLFSWEDKKMQAITAYIVGDKENKQVCAKIVEAYLSLSWEDKRRYASLYDNAISCTITKEYVAFDKEWLGDWHVAFNLPKTVKKISRWDVPGVNDIFISILKQKNTYDREYYDFEDAKKTLLSIVKR